MQPGDIRAGKVAQTTLSERGHDMQAEHPPVTLAGVGLELGTMLLKEERGGIPHQDFRLLLPLLGSGVHPARNGAQQLQRFFACGFRGPGCPVGADGEPAQPAVYTLLQEVGRRRLLAARAEPGELGVADHLSWLEPVHGVL